MGKFRRSNPSSNEFHKGKHRFEHWYRDNTVYFITARCRDRFRAFESDQAKAVFWNRCDHYLRLHGFEPWVHTLMDNHYHVLGYLKDGSQLGPMMRKLHDSVAKLVNDLLPQRVVPFWRGDNHNDYFDGCIRDVLQLERAFLYTRDQAVRAGIVNDFRNYPHTKVTVDLNEAIGRATALRAFLADVPYQRYQRPK